MEAAAMFAGKFVAASNSGQTLLYPRLGGSLPRPNAVLRRFRLVATTAILLWPALSFGQSSVPEPTIHVFGAYSVNFDYIAVPYLFVFNQPVSPFLATGGGA